MRGLGLYGLTQPTGNRFFLVFHFLKPFPQKLPSLKQISGIAFFLCEQYLFTILFSDVKPYLQNENP